MKIGQKMDFWLAINAGALCIFIGEIAYFGCRKPIKRSLKTQFLSDFNDFARVVKGVARALQRGQDHQNRIRNGFFIGGYSNKGIFDPGPLFRL